MNRKAVSPNPSEILMMETKISDLRHETKIKNLSVIEERLIYAPFTLIVQG
jgi:hypothetical protein